MIFNKQQSNNTILTLNEYISNKAENIHLMLYNNALAKLKAFITTIKQINGKNINWNNTKIYEIPNTDYYLPSKVKIIYEDKTIEYRDLAIYWETTINTNKNLSKIKQNNISADIDNINEQFSFEDAIVKSINYINGTATFVSKLNNKEFTASIKYIHKNTGFDDTYNPQLFKNKNSNY